MARNPIFLEKHGRRIFWGFAIVIIRVPDIFSDSMRSLDFFGYQYRLLKSASPWDPTYVEFYRSEKTLVDPVSHWFSLGGDLWELQLMPNSAWAASTAATDASSMCSSRMKRSTRSTIRYDVKTGVQRAGTEYTGYSVPALQTPVFSVTYRLFSSALSSSFAE